MKFPITRESLQAFDQKAEEAEKKEEYFQHMIDMSVKEICNEVVKGMSSYSREKRFIWRNLNNYLMRYPAREGQEKTTATYDYLPRLIEKLQETFIGCDIVVDPLKTYLIISWM